MTTWVIKSGRNTYVKQCRDKDNAGLMPGMTWGNKTNAYVFWDMSDAQAYARYMRGVGLSCTLVRRGPK